MTMNAKDSKALKRKPRSIVDSNQAEKATTGNGNSKVSSSKISAAKDVADQSSSSSLQQPPLKRRRVGDNEEEHKAVKIFDLTHKLGFNDNDRIEVEWEVVDLNNKRKKTRSGKLRQDSKVESGITTSCRWWGATLLKYDGRMQDNVAIRVLEYDPYPEKGFHEKSREEVMFLGENVLYSQDMKQTLRFRREGAEDSHFGNDGADEDVVYLEDFRSQLDFILMDILNENAKEWKRLQPAQQAVIAEAIATKKERLLQALQAHSSSDIITASEVRQIIRNILES